MLATSILCLLPVLLVTVNFQKMSVNALNCMSCIESQESCTGKVTTCTAVEDRCLNVLGEGTMGILNNTGVMKVCIASDLCSGGTATVTIGSSFTMRRAIECCMQDSCNNNKLMLPLINTTLNGLQCPVCHAKGSVQCESKETMSCTGSEDHCISMAGSMALTPTNTDYPSPFTARGCATKTMCDMKKELPVFLGLNWYTMNTVLSCTPATKSVNSANGICGSSSFGFILPSLLLLKYLH